jgi:hypothetical protein
MVIIPPLVFPDQGSESYPATGTGRVKMTGNMFLNDNYI